MNQQLDCAMVFCLAAQAHKAQGNLVQAIDLYKKACEVYVRCDQHMAPPVGLVYIEIAGCLSDVGDELQSEIFYSKAREIMCSNAPVMFKSVCVKQA
jgi:tetratricopeptide (TPR) repeat protein